MLSKFNHIFNFSPAFEHSALDVKTTPLASTSAISFSSFLDFSNIPSTMSKRLISSLLLILLINRQHEYFINVPGGTFHYGYRTVLNLYIHGFSLCTLSIPAKPLHNNDIVSVHFNHFHRVGIYEKLSRHLSMLTYIYLNVDECWLTYSMP